LLLKLKACNVDSILMRKTFLGIMIAALLVLVGCKEPETTVLVRGQLLGSDSVENIRIVALAEDHGPTLKAMLEKVRDENLKNDPDEIADVIRYTEFTYRRKGSTGEGGHFEMDLVEGQKYFIFVMNTGHAWCQPVVAVQGKEVKLTPGNAVW